MDSQKSAVGAAPHQQRSLPAVEANADTRALRGVDPTSNPLADGAKEVWSNSQNDYWTNGIGEVIDARSAPSAAWRHLRVNSLN